MAIAATRLWEARSCVAPLMAVGPGATFVLPAALGAPIGLALVADSRRSLRIAGLVLLAVAALAILSVVGFLTGGAATAGVALVVSGWPSRRAVVLSVAALGLAVLALVFAARASARCAAMSAAVADLSELDVRCTGVANGEPAPRPGGAAYAGKVRVRCHAERAQLSAWPVFPLTPPLFLIHWDFDRDTGRWDLAD
jgi:hypothetical protein